MNPIIKIESLDFGYNGNTVLKNINLLIEKGSFVSILGPNGSGKSTLLKNLSSILFPRGGLIEIAGKNLNRYKSKELARKMALVPQDTTIAYDFSVFDVVLMGRNPYLGRFEREKTKDYEIVKEVLKRTDTFHLRARGIKEISGGERQRVIIARALAQQPEILLLDEPTSHLDVNHQIEILHLLKKLNKEKNMTIVVVLHDINLAARFSSQIVLLSEGEILSLGTPEEVINSRNMEEAYHATMIVNQNPYTNSPYVIPLINEGKDIENPKKKIHIICGGGTGVEVLSKLDMKGHPITMGVINIGDSDWEFGKKLSIPMIEEMPFSGITEEAHHKNMEVITKSDILILTSIPYGSGNIRNLEAAYEGMKMGKDVYLINHYRNKNFDYVNGRAENLIEKMKGMGLKILESIDKLTDSI